MQASCMSMLVCIISSSHFVLVLSGVVVVVVENSRQRVS